MSSYTSTYYTRGSVRELARNQRSQISRPFYHRIPPREVQPERACWEIESRTPLRKIQLCATEGHQSLAVPHETSSRMSGSSQLALRPITTNEGRPVLLISSDMVRHLTISLSLSECTQCHHLYYSELRMDKLLHLLEGDLSKHSQQVNSQRLSLFFAQLHPYSVTDERLPTQRERVLQETTSRSNLSYCRCMDLSYQGLSGPLSFHMKHRGKQKGLNTRRVKTGSTLGWRFWNRPSRFQVLGLCDIPLGICGYPPEL